MSNSANSNSKPDDPLAWLEQQWKQCEKQAARTEEWCKIVQAELEDSYRSGRMQRLLEIGWIRWERACETSLQERNLLPLIGAAGGALVTFSAVRFGFTGLLLLARISCVNKGIASVLGAAGVFASGVASTHAFVVCGDFFSALFNRTAFSMHPYPTLYQSLLTPDGNIRSDVQQLLTTQSPALDTFFDISMLYGLTTLLTFKLFGGKFKNVAPSDIVYAGAYASGSVPADSSDYANSSEKNKIQSIGERCGCHHCGRRRKWLGVGPRYAFIGDHMPPNKYANGRPQRFFPQCLPCCSIQSNAVRMDRRTLIFPRSFRRYDWWTPLPLIACFIAFPLLNDVSGNVQKKWQFHKTKEDAKDWVKSWWPFKK